MTRRYRRMMNILTVTASIAVGIAIALTFILTAPPAQAENLVEGSETGNDTITVEFICENNGIEGTLIEENSTQTTATGGTFADSTTKQSVQYTVGTVVEADQDPAYQRVGSSENIISDEYLPMALVPYEGSVPVGLAIVEGDFEPVISCKSRKAHLDGYRLKGDCTVKVMFERELFIAADNGTGDMLQSTFAQNTVSPVGALPDLAGTREGYEFKGWKYDNLESGRLEGSCVKVQNDDGEWVDCSLAERAIVEASNAYEFLSPMLEEGEIDEETGIVSANSRFLGTAVMDDMNGMYFKAVWEPVTPKETEDMTVKALLMFISAAAGLIACVSIIDRSRRFK